MRFEVPGSPRIWILLTLLCIALVGFASIADEVLELGDPNETELHAFDRTMYAWTRALESPLATRVFTDLTSLGSVSVILVIATIVGAFLVVRGDGIGVAHLITVLVGAGAWPVVLKSFFSRARPSDVLRAIEAEGWSFPSGHSFGSAAVYLTLAFFAGRHLKRVRDEVFFSALALIIVLIVATSRVYLGVHFASDVVAGMLAGAAWAFGAIALFLRPYARQRQSR